MKRDGAYTMVKDVIRNGEELAECSKILWLQKHFPVGFNLYVLACEELGKAHLLWTYAALPNGNWDQLNPWPRQNSHKRRLEYYEIQSSFLLTRIGAINDIGPDNVNRLMQEVNNEVIKEMEKGGQEVSTSQVAASLHKHLEAHFDPFRTIFESNFIKFFGENPDDVAQRIEVATNFLHNLRLKSLYVEENGSTPELEWKEKQEIAPWREAMDSGFAYDLIQHHVQWLKSCTEDAWYEFNRKIDIGMRARRPELN